MKTAAYVRFSRSARFCILDLEQQIEDNATKALGKAWQLRQTYWRRADSRSTRETTSGSGDSENHCSAAI